MASQDDFLRSFGLRLARLLAPGLPLSTVQAAVLQVIEEAKSVGSLQPAPAIGGQGPRDAGGTGAGFGSRKLELVFAHDCRCEICRSGLHAGSRRAANRAARARAAGARVDKCCDCS